MAFDEQQFFAAVERRRKRDGLSWRQLGRQLSLSPSTFSRLARGRRPDVDTFMTLLEWLEMPASAFSSEAPPAGSSETGLNPLDAALDFLRKDPALASGDADVLEGIVRIAYQRFSSADD